MKVTMELQNKTHFVFHDLEVGEIFQPLLTDAICVKISGYAGLVLRSAAGDKGKVRPFKEGTHVLRAISMHVKLENTGP